MMATKPKVAKPATRFGGPRPSHWPEDAIEEVDKLEGQVIHLRELVDAQSNTMHRQNDVINNLYRVLEAEEEPTPP